jgi:hypothetical protein
MKQPTLPPHLEPAREFYDALAEMIAAEILRRLKLGTYNSDTTRGEGK